MGMTDIVEEFQRGSEAYWAGEVPPGWDNVDERCQNPFLMGWYLESQADNGLEVDIRG